MSQEHFRYILEQLRDEYLSENREEFERLYYAGDLDTTKQLFTRFCNNKNPTLYMQIKDAVGFSWQLIHSLYQPVGDILVLKRFFKQLVCSCGYGCGTRSFIDYLVLSNSRHT